MDLATRRSLIWYCPRGMNRAGGMTMKSILKKLLVQQPGQGASATLPELDGMP